MPSRIVRVPASAAAPISSSSIGISIPVPSTEKRVWPGKALQEALEGRDLGQPVEQLALVDRVLGRTKRRPLRPRRAARPARPLPAPGRSRSRWCGSRCAAGARWPRPRSRPRAPTCPPTAPAGRRRSSSSVRPWVAGSSSGSPLAGCRADRAGRRGGRTRESPWPGPRRRPPWRAPRRRRPAPRRGPAARRLRAARRALWAADYARRRRARRSTDAGSSSKRSYSSRT